VSTGASVESTVLMLTDGEADPAFRRRAAWALARADLRDGARLLEIGAGLGSLLMLAARLAAITPVALDLDLARLLGARRLGFRGPCVVADAAALPFRSGAFDRALACEVLEHLADDVAALAELRRACASHARLVITVPRTNFPPSWDPVAWLLGRLGMQPLRRGPYVGIWTGHRRLYDAGTLRDAAERAGWKVRAEEELVRGAFPFAHFLLYGVGKRLVEAGMADRRTVAAVGRSAEPGRLPPWWHPVGLAIRVLRACDARAERRARPGDPSVHLGALLTPGPP
jgi:SAM-dependent methyltransferase